MQRLTVGHPWPKARLRASMPAVENKLFNPPRYSGATRYYVMLRVAMHYYALLRGVTRYYPLLRVGR